MTTLQQKFERLETRFEDEGVLNQRQTLELLKMLIQRIEKLEKEVG